MKEAANKGVKKTDIKIDFEQFVQSVEQFIPGGHPYFLQIGKYAFKNLWVLYSETASITQYQYPYHIQQFCRQTLQYIKKISFQLSAQ